MAVYAANTLAADLRPSFAYTGLVSVGFKANENKPALPDRYVSTIAIAAAIIAAVRLATVPDLELNIPKVIGVVKQSVRLARTILDEAIALF